MVPPRSSHQGGLTRRIVFIAAVGAVAGGAFACARLGTFLAAEGPLQRADAIIVLAGSRMERPLEAGDLHSGGWAPQIVLTEDTPDGGMRALRARKLPIPTNAEIARDMLVRLGVPASSVTIQPDWHGSTAHEAHTIRTLALSRGWRRIIVVTSKFHIRRARLAVQRELAGTGVQLIMRATRYDESDPEHWWRTRAGIRWTASEAQKLIVYALGLGM
jgi:uncharacterized SAM-binding protein YcdF (DUF218 family)